jgi:hypothetical protein
MQDQPAQMDDLQCFVRGFHAKHVADAQKLDDAVRDLFIVLRSVLCIRALKHLV